MTENHDAAELEALASNPQTDWDVLHWIAENYPELRPTIAANPGTYQELVEALASLGDPAVDAALAAGDSVQQTLPSSPPTSPLAGMWDTTTDAQIPPYQEPEHSETEYLEPDYPAAQHPEPEHPEPDHSELEYQYSASDAVEPEPVPAPLRGAPLPVAESAGYAEPASTQEDTQRKGRAFPLLPVAAVLLGVVAIGAIVALLASFLGGDGDQLAEPTEPQPTIVPPEDEEDEEDDGEDGADEEPEQETAPLEEIRASVATLPEESACAADDDAAVVTTLLEAGAAAEGFPADEDTDTLEDAFSGLQSSCSTGHAAEVFTAARSAEVDGAKDAMMQVSTGWADDSRSVGLRGADQVSGFSAQDGNVECEFDDGLTCTVYSTTPELCDEGATYRMTLDGVDVDCDAHLESGGRETLSVDDWATDGFMVCGELSDRVTCYNSLELFGFEISNTGNYSY